ncbi:MAG: hypothetical protein IPK14_21150 [Blastocatellia bacterium]|nr:hypothetical protein [Blastocatellia bacterium]
MREIKRELKSLFTVALREVKSRITLFGAAFVIGLFPALFPVFNKFGAPFTGNDVGIGTFAITICVVFAFSLLLGESILGRELANRQMSFYFSRPLSATTLYIGKVLGALSIVVLSLMLTTLPSLLFFSSQSHQFFAPEAIEIYSTLTVLCLGLGVTAGIIFRSKSLWLITDLALTPVALVLGAFSFFVIFVAYFNPGYVSTNYSETLATALPFGLGLLLLVVNGFALSFGRSNIKSIHKFLSISFWSMIMTLIVGGYGVSQWIVSAAPDDLTNVNYAETNSKGSWVTFQGAGWGRGNYTSGYLLNVKSGNYHQLDNFSASFYGIVFSADGNKAVWLESKAGVYGLLYDKFSIVKADLSTDKIKPVYTDINVSSFGQIELSDDGSRLAFVRDNMITIFDLNTDKELATVHIPLTNKVYKGGVFLTPELARFYIVDDTKRNKDSYDLAIFELNVSDKKLVEVGKATAFRFHQIMLSSNNEKMILSNDELTGLYNAKTGELIANIYTPNKELNQRVRFIANDKIALAQVDRNAKKSTMQILSSEGQVEKTIETGNFADVYIMDYINNSQILVTLVKDYNVAPEQQLAILDINTGLLTVSKQQKLQQIQDWTWGLKRNIPTISSTSERYFLNKQGLVKMDFTKDSSEVMNSFGFTN